MFRTIKQLLLGLFRGQPAAHFMRQSLSDEIYSISTADTPFMGRVSRDRPDSFEWARFGKPMRDAEIEVALSVLIPDPDNVSLADWPYKDERGKAHIARARDLLRLARKLVGDKRMRCTKNRWVFNEGEFPNFALRIDAESVGIYIAASENERYCAKIDAHGAIINGGW